MSDYIKREELKTALLKYGFTAPDMTVTELVEDLPSADVADQNEIDSIVQAIVALERMGNNERKRGEWVRVSADKFVQHAYYFFRCSECGEDIIGGHNYCPNCGAKMEGCDVDVSE